MCGGPCLSVIFTIITHRPTNGLAYHYEYVSYQDNSIFNSGIWAIYYRLISPNTK